MVSALLFIITFAFSVSSSPPLYYSADKWILLSYDGYEEERAAVRAFYKRDIDMIDNPKSIDIAIGRHDFNRDGVEEIVSFISGSEFHGARASGYLSIFTYDGKNITGNRGIAGFPLENSTLNDPASKQIGVIPNSGGWDYLYINSPDIGVRIWETEIEPTSCASPPLVEEKQGVVVSYDPASWIGEYQFHEFVERTDYVTGEWMPPFMMGIVVNIYEWEGKLYAYIAADGRMFSGRARAIIAYSENEIHLLYDEDMKGGGNYAGIYKRSHMLSFERRDNKLLTSWGRVRPMLIANESSGVYFEFDPNAEFDTSVHEDVDPVVIQG
jgi:hypothetical protein